MSDQLDINPFDGFRVVRVAAGSNIRLIVELRGGGTPIVAAEIVSLPEEQAGEADMLECWLQATCRLLTAGGRFAHAVGLLQKLYNELGEYEIELDSDWHLAAVVQDVEEPTIVLVNQQTQEAMVVKEDLYAEVMPIEDFAAQRKFL